MPAKHLISIRLPGDLIDSLDVMAKHRQEDRTALVVRMLRFAQESKAYTCDHDLWDDRVCVSCGKHFEIPALDF